MKVPGSGLPHMKDGQVEYPAGKPLNKMPPWFGVLIMASGIVVMAAVGWPFILMFAGIYAIYFLFRDV